MLLFTSCVDEAKILLDNGVIVEVQDELGYSLQSDSVVVVTTSYGFNTRTRIYSLTEKPDNYSYKTRFRTTNDSVVVFVRYNRGKFIRKKPQ